MKKANLESRGHQMVLGQSFYRFCTGVTSGNAGDLFVRGTCGVLECLQGLFANGLSYDEQYASGKDDRKMCFSRSDGTLALTDRCSDGR